MPASPSAEQEVGDSRKETLSPWGEVGRGEMGRGGRRGKTPTITSSRSLMRNNDIQEVCLHGWSLRTKCFPFLFTNCRYKDGKHQPARAVNSKQNVCRYFLLYMNVYPDMWVVYSTSWGLCNMFAIHNDYYSVFLKAKHKYFFKIISWH